MNNTKLAWVAGLLDADGTISIARYKRKGYDKYYYMPLIRVCQAYSPKGIANCQMLYDTLGSSLSESRIKKPIVSNDVFNPNKTKKKSERYIKWEVTAGKADGVAKMILPYSVGKIRQVKLLIEFCKGLKIKYPRRIIPDIEQQRRQKCWELMRTYQEKGFEPVAETK